MALAHLNQMIPFSTATTTAKDRPIIDWLLLARIATIIAIVTTARAAGKAATLPTVRLIRQQAMVGQSQADGQDHSGAVQEVRHYGDGHRLERRDRR